MRRGPAYDAAEMVEEARRQRAQVLALTAPLDAAAFTRKPTPRGWSVGECLDHLTLINRIYLDAIDEAVRRGRSAGLTAGAGHGRTRRHGWMGNVFVRSLEPPPRPKVPTFRRTTPVPQRDRDVVLGEFLATQDRVTGAIDGARDLDLAAVRLRSPFVRALPLSLGQVFGAILAHNRRHIRQAERILEAEV